MWLLSNMDFEGSELNLGKWEVDDLVTSYRVKDSKLIIEDCEWERLTIDTGVEMRDGFPLQNGFAVEVEGFEWDSRVPADVWGIGISLYEERTLPLMSPITTGIGTVAGDVGKQQTLIHNMPLRPSNMYSLGNVPIKIYKDETDKITVD